MSRAGTLGNGGLPVSYRCRWMPFMIAFGGGQDQERVATALVSMVAISSIVDRPACADLHFSFFDRFGIRSAGLALLAVCVWCGSGNAEEFVVVPVLVEVNRLTDRFFRDDRRN